jgi:hypothetical protein
MGEEAAKTLTPISGEQAAYAMENGEFPTGIIASAPRVAVILTQDWCPQWTSMETWLERGSWNSGNLQEIRIYALIYNRVPYFNRFLSFKETVWNNWLIPYVRYYRNGTLMDESNYVSQREFFDRLGGKKA